MANRIDDNRLLPCPFCGEEAAIWYFSTQDRSILKEAYYVGCTNDNCGCELEHPGAFKSLDDAVSAWNRRHKAPEQESRWIPVSEKYEHHIDHTDCIWYGNDSGCPVTCSQYRDGWNDAMDYIFKNGDGYRPYRRNENG